MGFFEILNPDFFLLYPISKNSENWDLSETFIYYLKSRKNFDQKIINIL